MFGLSKRERNAYELVIESQREEIHWLRSCIPWAVPAAPVSSDKRSVRSAPILPLGEEPERLHMTEDEEDIEFYLSQHDLDLDEAKALLEAAGARNTEIELS